MKNPHNTLIMMIIIMMILITIIMMILITIIMTINNKHSNTMPTPSGERTSPGSA